MRLTLPRDPRVKPEEDETGPEEDETGPGEDDKWRLALYGTGDTKFCMFASLFSSWFIMLPLSYGLGIYGGFDLVGMWIAATIHLAILSFVVCLRFMRAGYMKRKFDAFGLIRNHSSDGSSRSEKPVSEAL